MSINPEYFFSLLTHLFPETKRLPQDLVHEGLLKLRDFSLNNPKADHIVIRRAFDQLASNLPNYLFFIPVQEVVIRGRVSPLAILIASEVRPPPSVVERLNYLAASFPFCEQSLSESPTKLELTWFPELNN